MAKHGSLYLTKFQDDFTIAMINREDDFSTGFRIRWNLSRTALIVSSIAGGSEVDVKTYGIPVKAYGADFMVVFRKASRWAQDQLTVGRTN